MRLTLVRYHLHVVLLCVVVNVDRSHIVRYFGLNSKVVGVVEQSGAVGACWAHNPEVDGSKPSSASFSFFLYPSFFLQ